MPKSALPEHLQDIKANFEDDKQFGYGWFGRVYTWVNQKTKTWFAFSYRCTEWWARWRKYPRVLWAVGGEGTWRYENEDGEYTPLFPPLGLGLTYYLSRQQLYKRWHFAIQWPLMISFHFYPRAADVPRPNEPHSDLDGKVWFFYWGHFDADLVYWMVTSMYVGKNWK